MSRRKVPLALLTTAALLLCLAPRLRGQELPDARESARQIASSANDDAITVEERREALRRLEEAARLFLGANETVEAARVLNRAGRLHLVLNAPRDALASHRRALELLRRTPSPDVKVDSLNGEGAVHMLRMRKAKAEKVLRQAIGLSRKIGYTVGQAQALLTLSDQQNFDNHPLALQTAREALALWQSVDNKAGLARTYAKLGEYYMAQNLLPESTQNYERALGLWRDLNNAPSQAEALIMLGFIEHRKGEWSGSIALQSQARALLDEKAEPYKMGQIASTLGEAFNENGLPEVSLTHFQRALEYYRLTEDPGAVAYATWGLGITHYFLRNYAEAETHLRQAIAALEGDPLRARCHEFLGRVYIETGAYDLALKNFHTALTIFTRAVNPKEAAQVRALMGQLFERQGQLERARRDYRRALATFERMSDHVNQTAVHYALGKLELRRGDYDAAEAHLRQSVEATEDIHRVPTSSDLTAAFSANVYERYEKYIECLMRLHAARPAQGFAARAFEASELARARSLAQLLRATQTNLLPGLDPELAAREKMLRQSLRMKEDQRFALLAKAGKNEELAELEAAMAGLQAEYRQVSNTIRASYPTFEQLTRPAAWDLKRIQEEVILDDQTVLLEYSLGADGSRVWVVTRDYIKTYDLPAQTDIEASARKVYGALATRPGVDTEDAFTPAAEELARLVLWPVAGELDKRRVIVVADDVLHYIPFQVLPASPSSGEMLVAEHDVINAPSASILGELRQEAARRQPAAKVLAAFGNPVFESNYAQRKDAEGDVQLADARPPETERGRPPDRDIELNGDSLDPARIPPLHYAKQELAGLRDTAAGGAIFVAEGFDATREKLIGTDLTQYAILHIATHGLLDPNRPEYSGLVLSLVDDAGRAQDGFVGLQDVYSLRAPVSLVVLSACRTGLGKDVRGEGLLGLTRGFMYAGASSVVASLWKVDDEATTVLMREFYGNLLQKKMPPAEALRAAQNRVRQNPNWQSPYYWAAFTLQGEYRQVIKTTPAASRTATPIEASAGGALLALLAGTAWWYRRRRKPRTAKEGA
jgi:CHAT domain-containing protein/predicted negative regulator of RcsB-dependent stress response